MDSEPERSVEELLRRYLPIAVDTVEWPGGMKLAVAAYATADTPPHALVSSARCIVTVGPSVLVYEDSHPSTDVMPGGRCEPGETWMQTVQREVFEETGWTVEPETLSPLGFLHYRHLTPVPEDHPLPHPDFFQVVMRGEGSGKPDQWTDVEGYVLRSWLVPAAEATVLPISTCGRAFLELLNR